MVLEQEVRWGGQRQVNKGLVEACSVPSVWVDEARLWQDPCLQATKNLEYY